MSTNMGPKKLTKKLTDAERRSLLQEKFATLEKRKQQKAGTRKHVTPQPSSSTSCEGVTAYCSPKPEIARAVGAWAPAAISASYAGLGQLSDPDEDPTFHCFMDLPAELQTRICVHALLVSDTTSSRGRAQPTCNAASVHIVKALHGRPDKHPAVLRFSKTLRQILLPLFYKHMCTFVIKSCPRMDRHCPLSRWVSVVGSANIRWVRKIVIALYEAERVYLELIITPDPDAFPRGSVRLHWPSSKGKTSTAVMVSKMQLGSKYPGMKGNEFFHKSHEVQVHDVVKEVGEIFQIGKQSAGGWSKSWAEDRDYTMQDALWGGNIRGNYRWFKISQNMDLDASLEFSWLVPEESFSAASHNKDPRLRCDV